MDERTSRFILISAGGYIVSQVVLLIAIGKDIELIVLSFGIFVACIVAGFALPGAFAQRVSLESVSMRRAKESPARQADMQQRGYDIDEEFLNRDGFGKTSPGQFGKKFVNERPETHDADLKPDTSAGSLEEAILSNAAFFGGLANMAEAAKKMDDNTLERIMVKMGYEQLSASEVRGVIVQLHESQSGEKTAPPDSPEASHEIPKSSLSLNTSLNNSDFNEYIKRSMSGEQDMQADGFGKSFEESEASPEPEMQPAPPPSTTLPPQVVKRMRGIRSSSGGKMKCENCMNHDAARSFCMNANIQVEKTEVCDAWQPRDAMG